MQVHCGYCWRVVWWRGLNSEVFIKCFQRTEKILNIFLTLHSSCRQKIIIEEFQFMSSQINICLSWGSWGFLSSQEYLNLCDVVLPRNTTRSKLLLTFKYFWDLQPRKYNTSIKQYYGTENFQCLTLKHAKTLFDFFQELLLTYD